MERRSSTEKFNIIFFKKECFFLKNFLKNISIKIDFLLKKISENFNKNECNTFYYKIINKLIIINKIIKKLIKNLIYPVKNIKNIIFLINKLITDSNQILTNIPKIIIQCNKIEHFNLKNYIIDIMIFILSIFEIIQKYLIKFSERVLKINSFIDYKFT